MKLIFVVFEHYRHIVMCDVLHTYTGARCYQTIRQHWASTIGTTAALLHKAIPWGDPPNTSPITSMSLMAAISAGPLSNRLLSEHCNEIKKKYVARPRRQHVKRSFNRRLGRFVAAITAYRVIVVVSAAHTLLFTCCYFSFFLARRIVVWVPIIR